MIATYAEACVTYEQLRREYAGRESLGIMRRRDGHGWEVGCAYDLDHRERSRDTCSRWIPGNCPGFPLGEEIQP